MLWVEVAGGGLWGSFWLAAFVFLTTMWIFKWLSFQKLHLTTKVQFLTNLPRFLFCRKQQTVNEAKMRRHKDTKTQGHKDTKTKRHKDKKTKRHKGKRQRWGTQRWWFEEGIGGGKGKERGQCDWQMMMDVGLACQAIKSKIFKIFWMGNLDISDKTSVEIGSVNWIFTV